MPNYDEQYWSLLEEWRRQEQQWYEQQMEEYFMEEQIRAEIEEEKRNYPLFFWKENL